MSSENARLDFLMTATWAGRPAVQAAGRDFLDLERKLRDLNASQQRAAGGSQQLEKGIQSQLKAMSGLPGVVDKAEKELDQLDKAARRAGQGVDASGDAVEDSLSKWANITQIASFAVPHLQRAGQAMVSFAMESVGAASDMQETWSKFNVVFGDQADSVTAKLEEMASAAGQSTNEFVGFASMLQDTFVPLGFARDEAADMSTALVQLAMDLGAWENYKTADVIRDLQSALVGNTESIRKYGVVANQAALEAKALEMGLDFVSGKMDAQTKAASMLSIIMESTADAHGAAAREAEGHAGVERQLEGAVLDLKIAFGEMLMPAMTEAMGAATQLVNRLTVAVEIMARGGGEVREMALAMIAEKESTEDLVGALGLLIDKRELASTGLGRLTKTEDDILAAQIETAKKLVNTAESYEEYEAAIIDAYGGTEVFNRVLLASGQALGVSTDNFYEYNKIIISTSSEQQKLTAMTERWQAQMGQVPETVDAGTRAADQFTEANAAAFASITEEAIAAGVLEARVWDLKQSQEAEAEAAELAAEAAEKLAQRQQALIEHSGDLAVTAMSNAAALGFYNEPLSALSESLDEATINELALGQALMSAADASGASAETMVALGLAYGTLTEAQAEAILRQIAMQRQAEVLGQLLADEAITIDEAKERMLGFAESLDGTKQEAAAATTELEAVGATMDDLDGKSAMLVLNANTSYFDQALDRISARISSMGGAGYAGPGDGGGPGSSEFREPQFAEGGYTGIGGRVHAGEYVFSEPAVRNLGVGTLESMHQSAKSGQSMGGGITIGEITIVAQPGQDGAQLFDEFSAEMARQANLQRTSGYR